MINIVLCGGSGTRLWPISRKLMPKHFANLLGEQSLFQKTMERNSKLSDKQIIVSNVDQYFLALNQLEKTLKSNVQLILEPVGRNTAPAIAIACLSIDPEEVVLVSPSDHIIKNQVEYEKCIAKAKAYAEEGFIVTFGIKPLFAETGFGYIEAEKDNVLSFKEKPDVQTAERYVASGNFFWNSGMFCFKAGVLLAELKKHGYNIFETSSNAKERMSEKFYDGYKISTVSFEDMMAIPSMSIDYAVIEKSDIVKVVQSDFGWSDLGSFDALYDEMPKDDNGNTINSQHISINSKSNLIYGSDRKVATIDVEDLIVIDTKDALLISKKGSSQKVKEIVQIVSEDTDLHEVHVTTHRPWGNFTVLEESQGFKIKRIVVNPGKRLSLQKHMHRNEHWIVVSGTASVTVDDKTITLGANESTYIKMGQMHRLSNDGKIPVVIIEAQVGEYTGEDDIVRISDDFDRQ